MPVKYWLNIKKKHHSGKFIKKILSKFQNSLNIEKKNSLKCKLGKKYERQTDRTDRQVKPVLEIINKTIKFYKQ